MGQAKRLTLLPPGTTIQGRWSKRVYQVEKLLGQGGCGSVYLVRDQESWGCYALKVSWDSAMINKEYEVLAKLNSHPQLKSLNLVPQVYHLDDLWLAGKFHSYLVMEYIQGITLQELLKKRGALRVREAVGIALLVSLILEKLHQSNYICGDLKAENFLYNEKNGQITMIDFGGLTKPGNSIKAFTPVYDRASWGQGTRLADWKYDLFALAILIFILISGKNPKPQRQKGWQILLLSFPSGQEYWNLSKLIRRGLAEEYQTAKNISQELLEIWRKSKNTEICSQKLDRLIGLFSWASFLFLAFSLWLFYS